jgi:hypothetical protein
MARAKPEPKLATGSAQIAQILHANQKQAREYAGAVGHEVLVKRIKAQIAKLKKDLPGTRGEFTQVVKRQTLAQLEQVMRGLTADVAKTTREQAQNAAAVGFASTKKFLVAGEAKFNGVATALRLREALQFDPIAKGVDASVLRRISADPGYRGEKAQAGVLERYGTQCIGQFEEMLGQAMNSGEDWATVRANLTGESTWLQKSPLFWAERIVRNEFSSSLERASLETGKQADQILGGGGCKILVCPFDDRTSWDSYQLHGQIRRLDEEFVDGMGRKFMAPPNRPNDRGALVNWRTDWPIPAEMKPVSDEMVMSAWVRERRKGSPPPRPKMSTIPAKEFGASPPEARGILKPPIGEFVAGDPSTLAGVAGEGPPRPRLVRR